MLAIYTRLSKEDDDSNSIKNQLREAKEYATKIGVTNYLTYDEGEGKSGTLGEDKRPKLNQLINDIKAGKITHIWMRKQDRLARSGSVALNFAEKIIKNKVHLYFGDKGEVDLNDYMVHFNFGIMAMVDQLKPKAQSQATIKALTDNAKEGKVAGIIPYGYYTKDSKPYVDKKQALVVNRIFDLYLSGKGCQAIADTLTTDNVQTKYGVAQLKNKQNYKPITWQSSTIYTIISKTWYNGFRTYQNVQYPVPRIVDEIKYNKVQRAKEIRKNKRFAERPIHKYLLAGLLKCHKCGSNLLGRHRHNNNSNFYTCASKKSKVENCGSKLINIPKLDTFILKHLFTNKDLLAKLQEIHSTTDASTTLKKQIEDTTSNITKAQARTVRYARLLGDELEGDDTILNQYTNSKKALAKLKDDLIQLQIELDNTTSNSAVINFETQFDNFSFTNDFNTIKEAVHSIIESIETKDGVDADGVTYFIVKITYNGFNEESFFMVRRPIKEWVYLSNTRTEPTPEELQEDIEAFEFASGTKIAKEDYHLYKQDFYTNSVLPNVIVERKELIDFNKK